MKLLVSVFERAKSKITSTRSSGRISSGLFLNFSFHHLKKTIVSILNIEIYFLFLDSDNEFNTNNSKQISSSGSLIILQQPRLSLSKWLCTNPSSIDKSSVGERRKEKNLIYFSHLMSHDTLIIKNFIQITFVYTNTSSCLYLKVTNIVLFN